MKKKVKAVLKKILPQKVRWFMRWSYQLVHYALSDVYMFCSGRLKHDRDVIRSYHNKYSGRCFIIGNGPSLTPEDLEMLKGEVTFACNKIYKIFPRTTWRPTYYSMIDDTLFNSEGNPEAVNAEIHCMKFVRAQGYLFSYRKLDKSGADKVCCLWSWWYRSYLDHPEFSEELDKGIFTIANVTYCLIQIARYMGFSEIYLLGQDNKYAWTKLRDGTIVRNEGVISYFSDNKEEIPGPETAGSTWEMDAAYEYADKYSREHGFRIFNATRGGFLEKFERVNLDDILRKK